MSHKLMFLKHKIHTALLWNVGQYMQKLAEIDNPDAYALMMDLWKNRHLYRFKVDVFLRAFALANTPQTLDLICGYIDQNPLDALPLAQLKQIDHDPLIYRVQQQFEAIIDLDKLPFWGKPVTRLASITVWLHRETSVDPLPYYQRTFERIIGEREIGYHLLNDADFMKLYHALQANLSDETYELFHHYHNTIFAEIDARIAQDNLFVVRSSILFSKTMLQHRPATDYIFKLYQTQLSVVQINWIDSIFKKMDEHLQTEDERRYLIDHLIMFYHDAINDKVRAALLTLLHNFDDERIFPLALKYRETAEINETYVRVMTHYRLTAPDFFNYALNTLEDCLQAIRAADRKEHYLYSRNYISDLAAHLGLYSAPHQIKHVWALIDAWDFHGASFFFAGFARVIDDNPFVFDVMVYGTTHRFPSVRRIAFNKLANCSVEVMPILLDFVRTGYKDQKRNALYALGQPKFAQAVPFLIDILLSTAPNDIQDILHALKKIDTEEAYAAINAWNKSHAS